MQKIEKYMSKNMQYPKHNNGKIIQNTESVLFKTPKQNYSKHRKRLHILLIYIYYISEVSNHGKIKRLYSPPCGELIKKKT